MRFIDHVCRFFDLNSDPNRKICYVDGDATRPVGIGKKLIIHCCNDIGGWGAGFVLALSKRDKNPENRYRSCRILKLGDVQFVGFAEPMLSVANMIGQCGCGHDDNGNPPIRYDAIRNCLRKVRRHCRKYNKSVHAPRFGSDLAGGEWNVIEKIIEEELTTWGISVTVYDWKG